MTYMTALNKQLEDGGKILIESNDDLKMIGVEVFDSRGVDVEVELNKEELRKLVDVLQYILEGFEESSEVDEL